MSVHHVCKSRLTYNDTAKYSCSVCYFYDVIFEGHKLCQNISVFENFRKLWFENDIIFTHISVLRDKIHVSN